MNNKLISAQKEIWNRLVKIKASNNIGNAYLFSGPKGSGKEELAIKFSQLLNCKKLSPDICYECESCIRFKSLQHERLNIVVPLPLPKTGQIDDRNFFISDDYINAIKKKSLDPFYKISIPKANRILIQSIRGLKKTLYLNQEDDGGRNMVIIFDSDLLCSGQGESGNALLKILEEPPEHTTIVLVTDYKKLLFETIISRCQNVDIPRLSNDYIFNWLIRKNIKENEAKFIMSICRGNVHQVRALSDQSIKKTMDTIEKLPTILINKNSSEWRWFTDYYSRLYTSSRLEFNYHFNLILFWFKNAAKTRNGIKSDFHNKDIESHLVSFNHKYPNANIYAIMLCIEDVKKSASQNLYMPLILLNLILDVQKHINE
ncbi:MAG: hypothetical protein CBD77_00895 [bacterium TMED217]|nr:MAG: hypothetical protein CBD77_00895 [bacterium TMED217]|tara:strand:- start:4748 stop:5866 length:1119 start_codon:yes stop_codon:yes gene_type:complete